MAAGTPGVGESPSVVPAPRSGGLGAGAVGSPTAGGAPTEYCNEHDILIKDSRIHTTREHHELEVEISTKGKRVIFWWC